MHRFLRASHIMGVDAPVAFTLLFGFLLSAAGVLGLAWYLQSGQWGEEPATAWWRAEGARDAGAGGGGSPEAVAAAPEEAGGGARGEDRTDG